MLLGVYLRTRAFDVPQELRWDEYHYVDTARGYLSYQYSDNDHPPLGKLIIAGVMHLVGDTPVGWRLASLICGFANIGLVAWITWITFRSRREWIEVDDDELEWRDAGLVQGLAMLGAPAVREDPGVDRRMKRLDPAIEHLLEPGHARDIGHRQPRLAKRPRGAARRDELEPESHEARRERDEPRLVAHGEQSPAGT